METMRRREAVTGGRRKYTAEFKEGAVRLVLGGRKASEVARDLGVHGSVLSAWVRQAKVDLGQGPAGSLTTEEKEELGRLRRENRELRLEREILKKAAAFFAKENT